MRRLVAVLVVAVVASTLAATGPATARGIGGSEPMFSTAAHFPPCVNGQGVLRRKQTACVYDAAHRRGRQDQSLFVFRESRRTVLVFRLRHWVAHYLLTDPAAR